MLCYVTIYDCEIKLHVIAAGALRAPCGRRRRSAANAGQRHVDVDVDVEDVLARAMCLFASFSDR